MGCELLVGDQCGAGKVRPASWIEGAVELAREDLVGETGHSGNPAANWVVELEDLNLWGEDDTGRRDDRTKPVGVADREHALSTCVFSNVRPTGSYLAWGRKA